MFCTHKRLERTFNLHGSTSEKTVFGELCNGPMATRRTTYFCNHCGPFNSKNKGLISHTCQNVKTIRVRVHRTYSDAHQKTAGSCADHLRKDIDHCLVYAVDYAEQLSQECQEWTEKKRRGPKTHLHLNKPRATTVAPNDNPNRIKQVIFAVNSVLKRIFVSGNTRQSQQHPAATSCQTETRQASHPGHASHDEQYWFASLENHEQNQK